MTKLTGISILRAITATFLVLLFAESAASACPASRLTNSTTADADAVMALFDCALVNPNVTGTAVISNGSGNTLVLDKPGGAALAFTRSGGNEFLIEDDSVSGSGSLAFYAWSGSGWMNTVNIKYNGNVGIGTNPTSARLQVEMDSAGSDASTRIVNSTDGAGSTARLDLAGGSSGSLSELTIMQFAPSNTSVIWGLPAAGYSAMFENTDSSHGAGLMIGTSASHPIVFGTGAIERVRVTGGGNVGIGTSSPSYLLSVNGSVAGIGAYINASDARLKTSVTPIGSDALEKIQMLRPVSFYWRRPTDIGMRGSQLGFIAQDVQKVFPGVVLAGSDKSRTLSLKYNEFIPLLTRAIQQQQLELLELRRENARLAADVRSLRQGGAAAGGSPRLNTAFTNTGNAIAKSSTGAEAQDGHAGVVQ